MGVFPGLFPLPAEACKITLTFAVQDYLRRGAGCQFGTFVFVRRGMGREEKLSVLDQVRDFDHQAFIGFGINGPALSGCIHLPLAISNAWPLSPTTTLVHCLLLRRENSIVSVGLVLIWLVGFTSGVGLV